MAEVLVQFTDPVVADGVAYIARACGARGTNGLWQGWIEFSPVDGDPTLRSPRETTQPDRDDTMYWATGLSAVYLEGALLRTLSPNRPQAPARTPARPADAVLDPFSVYQKGEQLLRQQLGALSAWHLVNIVEAYGLSRLGPAELNAMREPALIELIVLGIEERHRRSEATPRSQRRPPRAAASGRR